MYKPEKAVEKVLSFITYKKTNIFQHFLNRPSELLELPNEVINLFDTMDDVNGVFFSGDSNKDRYAWSYMHQDGSFYRFTKEILIIKKPFFIFAPENIVAIIRQEFIRKNIFIFEYGRSAKLRPSSFCEVSDNGKSFSVKKVEPICKN